MLLGEIAQTALWETGFREKHGSGTAHCPHLRASLYEARPNRTETNSDQIIILMEIKKLFGTEVFS